MASIPFRTRSVKDLQHFLKERGVIFSDQNKVDLVELCEKSSVAKNCLHYRLMHVQRHTKWTHQSSCNAEQTATLRAV